MPFWKHYVVTKGEVDDDDLPLAKHRIYDDDGLLKPPSYFAHSSPKSSKKTSATAVKVRRSTTSNRSQSPTASSPVSPGWKSRSASSPSSSPMPSSARSLPPPPSAAVRQRSKAVGATPSSPLRSPQTRSQAKASLRRKRSGSAAKAAKAAEKKRRASTPSRRGSTAARRSSRAPSQAKSPWTVPLLKAYADQKGISRSGASTKAALMEAIKKGGVDIRNLAVPRALLKAK